MTKQYKKQAMALFNGANFDFKVWEEREDDPEHFLVPELNIGLPKAPDIYRMGQVSFGKDPKRGRAIMRSRMAKRLATNSKFFFSEIFPLISEKLNWKAWKNLAFQFPEREREFMQRGGFVRYALGERASWIHPIHEPELIKKAIEIGAKPE
jgi:hypothetical protein